MLDRMQVWDAAVRCWARWTETGDRMFYERAVALFDTHWRLVK